MRKGINNIQKELSTLFSRSSVQPLSMLYYFQIWLPKWMKVKVRAYQTKIWVPFIRSIEYNRVILVHQSIMGVKISIIILRLHIPQAWTQWYVWINISMLCEVVVLVLSITIIIAISMAKCWSIVGCSL